MHESDAIAEKRASMSAAGVCTERIRPAGFPSDKKRRDAAELFKRGLGYLRAAHILELNPETVRDWEKRWQAGTFRPELARNQYRYPDELRARCIELRQQGTPWFQISRETGVSVGAMRKWVKAAETAERPPGD